MKKTIGVLFTMFFLIGIVSATWYLPWTWFQSPEENIQQEGKLFVIDNPSEWNVLKSTGEENNFKVHLYNAKNKSLEICFLSEINYGDKVIYNELGENIIDDQDKNITLKWDAKKCIINGTENAGYYISLSNAKAVNINEYIKLGEHSIIIEYQNQSMLNYNLDWAEVNVTLYKNISETYDNTVNDLFVYYNEDNYKFGATDTIENETALNNYKYELKSNIPITKEGNILYVQNPEMKTKGSGINSYHYYENHDFDFTDICSRGFNAWNTTEEFEGENYTITHYNNTADCKFSSYKTFNRNETTNYTNELNETIYTTTEIYDYYYEVTFLSDKNIDPVISISDSDWITTSNLVNVTAEGGASNHTHLNVSNTAPYDSLVGYWSFDGDLENTALTTAYDWSGEGNDGTYVDDAVANSAGGKYGEGAMFDGDGDYVEVPYSNPSLNFSGNDEITISAWIKPKNEQEGTTGWIVSQSSEILIRFDSSDDTVDIILNSFTSNDRVTSISNAGIDVWTHVVGTYNGSDLSIYVNAQEPSSVQPTGTYGGKTDVWAIGRFSTNPDNDFNGSIDEVMIFNTSLTEAQILEIYNNQSARFLETGGQDIYNQTFMNISSGNDKVNVSTQIEENMGSDINLTVGYYNGSWLATDPQTISTLTNYTFIIDDASTNLTLNYTFIAGNDTTSFYSPLILGDISFEAWSSGGAVDETAPTYSLNQTNSTINGSSTLFSLYWDDDTALEDLGQYIFSTNNTGAWANESAVNFTSTPQWANVTMTLNDTVGISIGWRMYATDNAGNMNVSEVFSLVTTSAVEDTCTYTSGNWAVDCSDSCTISENVDMMGNDFSTYGTGTITLTANITNWTNRLFEGTSAGAKCIIKGIGGWFV